MSDPKDSKALISQAAEDLFNYAIERDDVKWLTGQLSPESRVKRATFEYELHILKIISVGWSMAYHLGGTPKRKAALGELFWAAINDFSKELSASTGLMIGQEIDYFQILKERLDHYVMALQNCPDASEPAVAVGPEFAALCGHRDDLFAAMAGSKIFANAVLRTRQYLEALKLR